MIGLGRMGTNMVRRLLRAGHQCVVYDLQPQAVEALAKEGAIGATSIEDFVGKLARPTSRRASTTWTSGRVAESGGWSEGTAS
jgi:6-phosphogluconate dehydrogenase